MPTQNFQNHAKNDPLWHFTLLPLCVILLAMSIYTLVRHFDLDHGLLVLIVLAIVVATWEIRAYGLKVQTRVIRLEEQVRLNRLMPAEPSVVDALTIDQFVGLRFASDGEVPALARRAVAEKLDRKAIKQAVTSWRADEYRV